MGAESDSVDTICLKIASCVPYVAPFHSGGLHPDRSTSKIHAILQLVPGQLNSKCNDIKKKLMLLFFSTVILRDAPC